MVAGKIIYTIVFISLNAIIVNFEWRGTRKIGVAEIVGVSMLIIVALLNFWLRLMPANTFKLLFFFSIAILVLCELSKLSFSNLSATVKRVGAEKGGASLVRVYKKIRFILVFVFFPLALTVGQVILLWQNTSPSK
jgi:hypothetical protein